MAGLFVLLVAVSTLYFLADRPLWALLLFVVGACAYLFVVIRFNREVSRLVLAARQPSAGTPVRPAEGRRTTD